jgi:hypothetical protein
MSENQVTIKISDLKPTGVDLERIAIRQENFGNLIVFSRTGEASFTAPKQNTNYDIFLMNTSGMTKSEHYQKIDDWVDRGAGILGVPRNATWRREDRDDYTGPEGPIISAIQQLHDAVQYPWYNYGSLIKVSSGGSNFGVGYAEAPPGAGGYHSSDWAGVNPDKVISYNLRIRIFIEEIFELITGTAGLYAGTATYPLITDENGNLNQIGKELFAYVYVKDERTASSSSTSRFSIGFK